MSLVLLVFAIINQQHLVETAVFMASHCYVCCIDRWWSRIMRSRWHTAHRCLAVPHPHHSRTSCHRTTRDRSRFTVRWWAPVCRDRGGDSRTATANQSSAPAASLSTLLGGLTYNSLVFRSYYLSLALWHPLLHTGTDIKYSSARPG